MPTKNQSPKIQPSPYPFKITYLSLPEGSEKILKRIDRWHLLEYLRQEALRRSEILHALLKKDPINGIYKFDRNKYGSMWWNIFGIESPITLELLEAMNSLYFEKNCFSDIREYLEEGRRDKGFLARFGKEVLDWDQNHLLLHINATYPPSRIVDALRVYLKIQHKKIKKIPQLYNDPKASDRPKSLTPTSFSIPWHPVRKPFFKSFKAWLGYLRCYDLRRCKALSYGQIAKKIYGDNKKRDLADKAFDRVTQLIYFAENNIWPPTGIK
ncbi:MAG: hypothetical protein KC643_32690 [Nitrospira sp.]|nr:hypothetical protein [Nitrospira sp.]